jgi:hypothetical protein
MPNAAAKQVPLLQQTPQKQKYCASIAPFLSEPTNYLSSINDCGHIYVRSTAIGETISS